jgi:pimeloyl-ACP methyl ester carboxylesterase
VLLGRAAAAAEPGEVVILLHGLGRTSASMARLASAFKHEGYRVVNLSYRSRGESLEQLATQWLPGELARLDAENVPPVHVHFVTHSMGGIIVRLWLRERGAPAHPGRVVMLAPPNAGSEVTDHLLSFALFRWFTGKNGRRLGTDPTSLPRQLGDWPAAFGDLGVIAGDASLNPLFSSWLPGADDGKVTVASTHIRGERDHVVLPYSHTWIGWREETIGQAIAFVRSGRFIR